MQMLDSYMCSFGHRLLSCGNIGCESISFPFVIPVTVLDKSCTVKLTFQLAAFSDRTDLAVISPDRTAILADHTIISSDRTVILCSAAQHLTCRVLQLLSDQNWNFDLIAALLSDLERQNWYHTSLTIQALRSGLSVPAISGPGRKHQ